ncbi:hypothetical protein VNI00_017098 [Paramarasmius palmivorus]|uniref:Uncharacterized protein n=1 Tax=Paramarasmius palmivorus TaxID=297713 RepID=A0AAW0B6Y3_9AGAR
MMPSDASLSPEPSPGPVGTLVAVVDDAAQPLNSISTPDQDPDLSNHSSGSKNADNTATVDTRQDEVNAGNIDVPSSPRAEQEDVVSPTPATKASTTLSSLPPSTQSSSATPAAVSSDASIDQPPSDPQADASTSAPAPPSTPRRLIITRNVTPRSSKRVLTRLSPKKPHASPVKRAKSGVKKKVGNPGNFDGKPLEFLQEELKVYKKLKPRSRARSQFFVNNYAKFTEKFPDFRLPSKKSSPPPAELTAEERAKMTESECKEWDKSYKRKMEMRDRTEEQCLRDALKAWFQWHGGDVRAKDRVSVGRFLQQVKVNDRAPKKKQIPQVVMSHPDYRDVIKNLSEETGKFDRLTKCTEAATAFLKTLTDDQRKVLEEDINAQYLAAKSRWDVRKEGSDEDKHRFNQEQYRKSLGRIVQPFLDGLRDVTGLDVGLLIGEDVDGQGNWDGAIYSAQADEAPKLADFDPEKLDANFVNFFYRWLQHLRSLSPSKDQPSGVDDQVIDSATSTSGSENPPVAPASSTPLTGKKGNNKALSPRGSDDDSGSDSDEESDWSAKDGQIEEDVEDGDKSIAAEDQDATTEDEDAEPDNGRPQTFEEERASNIKRNKALLKKLGLDRPVFEAKKPNQKRAKKERMEKAVTVGTQRRSERNKGVVKSYAEGEAAQDHSEDTVPSEENDLVQRDALSRLMDMRKHFLDNDVPTVDLEVKPLSSDELVKDGDHAAPNADGLLEVAEAGEDAGTRIVCEAVVEAYEKVKIPHREPFILSDLDDGPIKDVMTYLTTLPKGNSSGRPAEYTSAVYLWYDLQELWESQGYKRGKLPMKERPPLIHQWCKKGHIRGFEPSEGQEWTADYLRRQFWVWWSEANPEWRRYEGMFVLPDTDGDLSTLHQAGKDGLVLLLVVLRWWYDMADGLDINGMWMEALKSVTVVMEALINELGSLTFTGETELGTQKRKRVSEASSRVKGTASKRRKL